MQIFVTYSQEFNLSSPEYLRCRNFLVYLDTDNYLIYDNFHKRDLSKKSSDLISNCNVMIFLLDSLHNIEEFFLSEEGKMCCDNNIPLIIYDTNGSFSRFSSLIEGIYEKYNKNTDNLLVSNYDLEIQCFIDNYKGEENTKEVFTNSEVVYSSYVPAYNLRRNIPKTKKRIYFQKEDC